MERFTEVLNDFLSLTIFAERSMLDIWEDSEYASDFQFNGFSLNLALAKGVENNDVATVDRILQYDPVGRKNFNVNGSLHDSLLHKAVRNRNYKICKMLLKFGADVNLLNFDDQNPLNVAEANGESSICKLLVRKRKEKRIMYKKTLHICARKNDLTMCKIHINSVDVNERDEKMRTPLHVAVIFASDAICDLLLKYGADIHAKDSYMDDPIQIAFYYGRVKLRERMLCGLPYIG